jgi:hypothetical protein
MPERPEGARAEVVSVEPIVRRGPWKGGEGKHTLAADRFEKA